MQFLFWELYSIFFFFLGEVTNLETILGIAVPKVFS